MKLLSTFCILAILFTLQQNVRSEEEFVVIEEVVFEEVDATTVETYTDMTEQPDNTTSTTQSTTQEATTAAPTDPPTTSRPIDAPQPIPPTFDDLEVPVNATVREPDGVFNDSLKNPVDPYYRQMALIATSRMDNHFSSNDDYVRTRVTGFRSGSVIADVVVIMKNILAETDGGNFTFCQEIDNINDDNVDFFNNQSCNTYLEEKVKSTCSSSSSSICPDTWTCQYQNSRATCQHACYIAKANDPSFCVSSSQICSVSVEGSNIAAECSCRANYLKAGPNSCIHQNIIIIIASVVGGFLLIAFIAIVASLAVRLNRKPFEYIDPYRAPKGGKRAADLWASVPDDTSQNLRPYADELANKGAENNSPKDSDSGRVTSGNDNQAFVGDDNKTGWNNVPLNDDDNPRNYRRDDPEDDKISEVSALDIDDTYMRSLLSSSAYQEIGESEFQIKRPVFRMDNLKNQRKDEEKSEGEEYVF